MYNPIYPSVVLKIFKDGCQKPFSLFLLTNKYVLSPEASKLVGKKLLIGHGNTLYTQAMDPSPLVGGLPKTELTYSQYMQAMPCFIELHHEFHGNNLAEAWQGHFRNVIDVEFLEATWHICLQYCIEICCIATQRGFRPQNWHQNVYDGVKKRYKEELFDARIKKLDLAIVAAQTVSHSVAPNSSSPMPPRPIRLMPAHPKLANIPFGPTRLHCPKTAPRPHNASAAAVYLTLPRTAIALPLQTETLQSSFALPMAKTGLLMGNPSATTSTTLGGVPKTAVPANTSAPFAAPLTMVAPNLIPNAWESMLRRVGLLNRFGDIPIGLRDGFCIGAAGPVTNRIICDNHKLARDRPKVIHTHINDKLTAGQYFGPFLRLELKDAIGPFRTTPLGTVDKPLAPGKFRIVQDFLHPWSSPSTSLNSQINAANFPCEWGFFHNVVNAIYDLPEGSMAATCDVDAAFRQIPIHPDNQPHTIIAWDGNFYVDGFLPFGAASASGIFGRPGDVMACIYAVLGFGTVLKWVDNFLFIQAPPASDLHNGPTAFSLDAIYEIAATLGWPWKISKSVPFANIFVYLGFEWDIARRWVSLPLLKRKKYLARIHAWLSQISVSLTETEKTVGSLIHCTLAIPEGRPCMSSLIAFQATFPRAYNKRFLRKTIPENARCNVEWWIAKLTSDNCGSSIARPPPESKVHVSSNASTSFGLGVVIDNQWWSWRLLGGWKSNNRDIGWAEAVALELAVDGVISLGFRNTSIVCHCNNQGVVYAGAAGRSRNAQQNATFIRILDKAASAGLHITICYIKSAENPADEPSRGIAPTSGSPATVHIPIPSIYAPFLAPAML